MNSLVSIIIPTFNRAELIRETLDSIAAQTYANWECIVVDDGSNDDTDKVLESYCKNDSRFKYYHRPNGLPKGANVCRNYGFELSNGEYINWFDSDDLMGESFLDKHIQLLQTSKADCSICNLAIFTEHKDNVFFTIDNCKTTSETLLLDYIKGDINLGTPSILWRKKTVSGFHFNTSLFRAQELDFHFRVFSAKSVKSVFTNATLAFIRRHTGSITARYNDNNQIVMYSELEVRRTILKYALDSFLSKKDLEKVLHLYFVILRKILRSKNMIMFYKELNVISKLFSTSQFRVWKMQLQILVLLYLVTGREFRLKIHFANYNFIKH